MAAFEAAVGPVDRLRGETLPDGITLRALILSKSPGPDGVHYKPSDIISDGEPEPICFKYDNYRLMSDAEVNIPLKAGTWPFAVMLLVDENGEPFGLGAVLTPNRAAIGGGLKASRNRIQIANHRRR